MFLSFHKTPSWRLLLVLPSFNSYIVQENFSQIFKSISPLNFKSTQDALWSGPYPPPQSHLLLYIFQFRLQKCQLIYSFRSHHIIVCVCFLEMTPLSKMLVPLVDSYSSFKILWGYHFLHVFSDALSVQPTIIHHPYFYINLTTCAFVTIAFVIWYYKSLTYMRSDMNSLRVGTMWCVFYISRL